MNYSILLNKKFNFKSNISKRSIQISEAFGVGLESNRNFTVFNNIRLDFKDRFVVYVTGDSGGGKTVLLNLIEEKFSDSINYKNIDIDENEIVCEGVGKDLNQSLSILNVVGLSDAFVYLRQYKQLSDGQKMRYKIAKMIDSEKKIFIIDEFCALLDRTTAKIISFNLQKYIRKNNKILFVATTHDDLEQDLNPDIYIYKKFQDELTIHHRSDDFSTIDYKKECSVVNDIKFVKLTTLKDIESLHTFHYKSGSNSYKHLFGLKHNNILIAYLMISTPQLLSKGRNVFTDNKYAKMTTENVTNLNKDFESISRVVVHPKFRGIGLAQQIIKEYLHNCQCKYVETMSVMSNYNPFFEKCGMIEVEYESVDKTYDNHINNLLSLNFDKDMIKSFEYLKKTYNNLDNDDKSKCFDIIFKLYKRYCRVKCLNTKNISYIDEFESFYSNIFKNDIKYYIYENKKYIKKEIININELF